MLGLESWGWETLEPEGPVGTSTRVLPRSPQTRFVHVGSFQKAEAFRLHTPSL